MMIQKQNIRDIRMAIFLSLCLVIFLGQCKNVFADRGKVAIINQNFFGVSTEDINNPKMVFDTYNATTENPNDPVNEKVYTGKNEDEVVAKNQHGTLVLASFQEEMGKHTAHDNPDILLVKTAPNSSANAEANDATMAKGINAASDWGADVINISMGSSAELPQTRSAIEKAKSKGATVVIASGNSGESSPNMGYPAKYGGGIAVGAHDEQGHPLAYTSGLGDEHLDLTARPSLQVIGSDGSTHDVPGTSFAAPVVAADAYLLKKSADPAKYDTDGDGRLSQDEVRVGLNSEAGKRFPSISSITHDRKQYLKEHYNFIDNTEENKNDAVTGAMLVTYDKEREENYIKDAYLNTGRFNEFYDVLDDVRLNQDYCYASHAYQICGFISKVVCEAMMPQDVGACGRVGDIVQTKNGPITISSVDLDGDGNPDFEDDISDPGDDSGNGSGGGSGSGTGNGTGTGGGGTGSGGSTTTPTASGGLVNCGKSGQPSCTICDLIEGIHGVIQFLVELMSITGIVIITIAGVMYIVSSGNPGMTTLAKSAIKNVLIGITVILVAFISITFIINTVFDYLESDYFNENDYETGLINYGNMWEFNCDAAASGNSSNPASTSSTAKPKYDGQGNVIGM